MRKLNKRICQTLLSLSLLALAPSAVNAQGYSCNPCGDYCNLGKFDVGADFIYWKPCVDDLHYATSTKINGVEVVESSETRHHNICCEWQPGFRIWVGKPDILGCVSLMGQYTYFHFTKGHTVHGTNDFDVFSTLTPSSDFSVGFSKIGADWDLRYQTFDVLFGYPISFCECDVVTPFFGVTGLFLNQQLSSHLSNDNATGCTDHASAKWSADSWGLGLKLGTDLNYPLGDGLRLMGRASGSIVAGDSNDSFSFSEEYGVTGCTQNNFSAKFSTDRCCLVIPGFDISAGAGYTTCMCGMELDVYAGYEFHYLWSTPTARRFLFTNDVGSVFSSPLSHDLSFQGLFVGVNLSF